MLDRFAIVAALCVPTACSGPSGPLDPARIVATLTETRVTDDIVFHFSPGDAVDSDWQQAYHAWAVERLGVSMPDRLQFYKARYSSLSRWCPSFPACDSWARWS